MPPGSTPLRELAHAVAGALTLPKDVAEREEIDYLRASRDRARIVSVRDAAHHRRSTRSRTTRGEVLAVATTDDHDLAAATGLLGELDASDEATDTLGMIP